jgi:hypothetical protein
MAGYWNATGGAGVGTCFTYVALPLANVRVTALFNLHRVEKSSIVKATQLGN